MLMKNGQAIFKSPVQQDQFTTPFRLESGNNIPNVVEVTMLDNLHEVHWFISSPMPFLY